MTGRRFVPLDRRRDARRRREDPRRRRRARSASPRCSRRSTPSMRAGGRGRSVATSRPGISITLLAPARPASGCSSARTSRCSTPRWSGWRSDTADGFERALGGLGHQGAALHHAERRHGQPWPSRPAASRSIASRPARPTRCAARRSCPASRTRWWSTSAARRRMSAACDTASRARPTTIVEVGGVRTLFRMPDLLSIGLGGGSLVDPSNPARIGPASVGYRLTEQALVFGGEDADLHGPCRRRRPDRPRRPRPRGQVSTRRFVAAALARVMRCWPSSGRPHEDRSRRRSR